MVEYKNRKGIFRVRIRNMCIGIFLMSLLSIGVQQAIAQIEVIEEWVAKYSGPADLNDIAQAMAIDSSGNVYITGTSIGIGTNMDYATISYDSSGNQRWVRRYNGPANSYDYATAIDTDSYGNIYVTGWSWGIGTGTDYATVSYDVFGNERWVARYNGPLGEHDKANAIVIDSYGNIYITGESGMDSATVSYDSTGHQRWVARYGGIAYDITADSYGNIYVTGTSYVDYTTVSYDVFGNERWVAKYNGPANINDVAYVIVTDSSGNVYVTGDSNNGTSWDYATVSYDSSGNERWVARYDGTGNSNDEAFAITVDYTGNIYVTGYSYSSLTGSDYVTISYDSFGNQRWIARYNGGGGDIASAITIDPFGIIYVTGNSWSWDGRGFTDYATVAYDSTGNQQWIARYKDLVNNVNLPKAITTDLSGNIYVTGWSYDGTLYPPSLYRYDYLTIKYSPIPKLPLGSSIESQKDPGKFKVYVPSRYGGELTVSVVDSQTGFPTGNVELFYPDFNTPIPSTQDMDSAPSIFKYEVPYDKFGWYLVKVTGSTNYTVSNTFIERGEILPERKPWNISTWWPFSDVYDTGDSLSAADDTSTISEIETLDDSIYPKYDAACGLSGIESATYWETTKSVLANGHYIYNGEDRETHAEFDWKYNWNGANGTENPGLYDFYSDAEGLFYSDGDLNDTYNSTWWGHCNGWANASIVFQDPNHLRLRRNGFTPEEVKGLLTEIGMREVEKDEENTVYLTPGEDEGAWTKEFHDFLRNFIRDKKLAIWGNLKSTTRKSGDVDEVWNHPIWFYEASMKERLPQEGETANERLVDVTLSLKAADDLGGNVREDSPETGRPWEYHLMYNEIGKIDVKGSGWDTFGRKEVNGEIIDDPNTKYLIPYLIHPKSVSDVFIGQGASNPYITEERIKANIVESEIKRPEW